MPQQAAEGEEESNDFRPQHNCCHPADSFRTQPHHERYQQCKTKSSCPCRDVQRHLREGVMQNRTAGRNIGVSQDIEHKSNGNAVDYVPAFAQQIFGDGVKARTDSIIQVSFQNHQAGMQHTEPGKDQRRH